MEIKKTGDSSRVNRVEKIPDTDALKDKPKQEPEQKGDSHEPKEGSDDLIKLLRDLAELEKLPQTEIRKYEISALQTKIENLRNPKK